MSVDLHVLVPRPHVQLLCATVSVLHTVLHITYNILPDLFLLLRTPASNWPRYLGRHTLLRAGSGTSACGPRHDPEAVPSTHCDTGE